MNSLIDFTQKGFDLELWEETNQGIRTYLMEIKYPCGERLVNLTEFDTIPEAIIWAINILNEIVNADHQGCLSEYCNTNKFKIIKSLSQILPLHEIEETYESLYYPEENEFLHAGYRFIRAESIDRLIDYELSCHPENDFKMDHSKKLDSYYKYFNVNEIFLFKTNGLKWLIFKNGI